MKSERSMQQVYWPTFRITRIKAFVGRTVGSLSASDLDNLRGGWLKRVEQSWKDPRLDDDLRAHYWAIRDRLEYDQPRGEPDELPEVGLRSQRGPGPAASLPESAPRPLPERQVQQELFSPIQLPESPPSHLRVMREAGRPSPTQQPMRTSPAPVRSQEPILVQDRPASGLSEPRLDPVVKTVIEQSEPTPDDRRQDRAECRRSHEHGDSSAAAKQETLEAKQPQEPEAFSPERQSLELTRVPTSEDKVLQHLDQANVALDKANSLEEVKEIADIAAAAHVFAKRAKRGKEVENKAAAYCCRAVAKLGRMMPENRKAKKLQKRGRPGKRVQNVPFSDSITEKPRTFAELGINKRVAAQARQLAKFQPDDFEARLNAKLKEGTLSRTSTLADPKPKEAKSVTSRECLKTLFKLINVLARSVDDPCDETFPSSQKRDIEQYRAIRPKFIKFINCVDAFIKSQPVAASPTGEDRK
jgi:hypothetical protein